MKSSAAVPQHTSALSKEPTALGFVWYLTKWTLFVVTSPLWLVPYFFLEMMADAWKAYKKEVEKNA